MLSNPPAPLRGHQAVGGQSAVHESCISQSFSFYSPSVLLSAVQQSVVLLVLRGDPANLPPPDHMIAPPGFSPASQPGLARQSKYYNIFPAPCGPPKCGPRCPKSCQNEVLGRPEDPQISKKSKIGDFKKTSVFTRFSSHLTIIFRSIFTPKSLKKSAYHLRPQV